MTKGTQKTLGLLTERPSHYGSTQLNTCYRTTPLDEIALCLSNMALLLSHLQPGTTSEIEQEILLLCQLAGVYRTAIHTQKELFEYFSEIWIPRLEKVCPSTDKESQSCLSEAKQSYLEGNFNFFKFKKSVESISLSVRANISAHI